MTTIQRVAQVFGGVFLLVGILGFLVSGGSMEADPAQAPRVFGLFPVNLLHNVVHLASGIVGLLAARSVGASVTYCRVFGAVYLLLVPLGVVIPTTFGLMPIGGHDIWLHALLGIGLVYFGFTAGRPATRASQV